MGVGAVVGVGVGAAVGTGVGVGVGIGVAVRVDVRVGVGVLRVSSTTKGYEYSTPATVNFTGWFPEASFGTNMVMEKLPSSFTTGAGEGRVEMPPTLSLMMGVNPMKLTPDTVITEFTWLPWGTL